MEKKEQKLGEILRDMDLLDDSDIEEALALQKEREEGGESLLFGEAVVQLGYVLEQDVRYALALQFELPYIRVDAEATDPEIVRKIPHDFARRNQVLPLHLIGNELALVVADPRVIDKVEKLKGFLKPLAKLEFTYSMGERSEIESALEAVWGKRKIEVEEALLDATDFRSDPSGGLLLEQIVQKGDFDKGRTLYFDFYPYKAEIWCRRQGGTEKLSEVNEEWSEILNRRIREETKEGVLSLKIDGERIVFEVFWAEAMVHKTAVLREVTELRVDMSEENRDKLAPLFQSPRGLLLFSGTREVSEEVLLFWLQELAQKGKRVIGFSPDRAWEVTGVTWLDQTHLISHLHKIQPDLIYIDTALKEELLTMGLQLALEGKWVILGAYLPTVGHLVSADLIPHRFQPFLQGVFRGGVEALSLPRLCQECRSDSKREDEALVDMSSYWAQGCDECDQTGYSGEKVEIIEPYFPGSHLWNLLATEENSPDEIMEEYRRLSPLYQQGKELLDKGEISLADSRFLFL